MVIAIKAQKSKPEALYRRVRGVCAKLEMEAKEIGLTFDNDKKQLLLPPGWDVPVFMSELPPIDIRSDILEEGGDPYWIRTLLQNNCDRESPEYDRPR